MTPPDNKRSAYSPIRIGMVVGETSGDILGAGLMRALQAQYPNAVFEGVGGPQMVEQGFNSLFPQDRLAVMGLVEPLKRLPELLKMRKALKAHFINSPPSVFIGIDSPDFNLNLECALRQAGIKTVHYVSPSVWAWRLGRIKTIAKAVDLMLTLFPFEKQFYDMYNVNAACVGHPLADDIPLENDKFSAWQQLVPGSTKDERPAVVVAVMPGSRASEVARMAPTFLASCELMAAEVPHIQFLLPAANKKRLAQLAPLVASCSASVHLLDGQSHTAMAAADAVLMASGTTSLEALLLKRPMVIAYKVATLSYWIFKKMVKVPYIGLPNLLAQKPLVPEFIQHSATPGALAEAIINVLPQSSRQQELINEFDVIHRALRKNASTEAATQIGRLIDYGNQNT